MAGRRRPVVVAGAQANPLVGARPGRVVAFRASSQGWTQVPVQVDERKTTRSCSWPTTPGATPATWRLRRARWGGGVEVRIADPAATDSVGFVYLFPPSDGSLDPSAGQQYVTYTFGLNIGDYKTIYKRLDGPNPENSTITRTSYSAHFSDRWLLDRVSLTTGDRPGADVVDRVMYRFPGTCGRTEGTFDDAEGAFVVNKTGPVRALRSYVGANSGPNTQATDAFYGSAMETTIDLRVHAIPGVGASLDLSQQAFGMTFRNPQVTATVPAGTPSWWTMTGAQGQPGLRLELPVEPGPNPERLLPGRPDPTNQWTGDGQAVAVTGAFFNSSIACTDPGQGCNNTLRSRFRTVAGPARQPGADRHDVGLPVGLSPGRP
jgi:hypothetical protein